MNRLLKLKEDQKQLNLYVAETFSTHAGKQTLEYLKRNYYPNRFTTDNPHTSAIKSGKAELVHDILRRIEDGLA